MTEARYTIGELKWLLRHYALLGDARPPTDPNVRRSAKRLYGHAAWWETAALKRADLDRALAWLAKRDSRASYAIRAYYVAGCRQREIARVLDVDQSTVSRYCADGLTIMLAWLNGRLTHTASYTQG